MKISVIVPVYNTEKYLDRCLASLTNQTLKDIEIIVINDGSKENVDSIIKKYQDQIIYIKNKNHGVGYTRNLGIKKAKGEYLGFVDSDDYVDVNMFLEYYNYAVHNDLDMVVGNLYRVQSKIITEDKIKHFEIGNIYDNKQILIDIDYGPCNKIFKKELLINNNIWFEEKLKYEDFPFVAKALKCSKRIGHIANAFYYYNIRYSSETTTLDKKDFDIFKVLDIVNNYYKEDFRLREEIEYLNVYKLLNYNIIQRNQINNEIRNNFIDLTFEYIKENFPDYRKNKYLKKELLLKRIIKNNKIITKIYCNLYPKNKKIC